ncbi:MAG: VOC family protein [Candidatus Sumerlaeota bacterium]|nr:VOC family protein [Candidatus Sumerlaeota bacterium]
MRFEHFGINVPDARAMAEWLVKHCGMRVLRAINTAPYTCFLADERGMSVIEIYTNPAGPIPDYSRQHPLQFHWAFAVDDPDEVKDRLVAAGASVVEEIWLEDGSHLFMLRDPWGVPLQLCKRTKPL